MIYNIFFVIYKTFRTSVKRRRGVVEREGRGGKGQEENGGGRGGGTCTNAVQSQEFCSEQKSSRKRKRDESGAAISALENTFTFELKELSTVYPTEQQALPSPVVSFSSSHSHFMTHEGVCIESSTTLLPFAAPSASTSPSTSSSNQHFSPAAHKSCSGSLRRSKRIAQRMALNGSGHRIPTPSFISLVNK